MPLSKRIVVHRLHTELDTTMGPQKKGTTQQERGSYIVQPSLLFDLESQLPDDRSPHRTSRRGKYSIALPPIHFKKVSHYYNLLDQIRLLRILWLWNFQFKIVSKFFIPLPKEDLSSQGILALPYSIRQSLLDLYNVQCTKREQISKKKFFFKIKTVS